MRRGPGVLIATGGAALFVWGIFPTSSLGAASRRSPTPAESHHQRRSASDSGYWTRHRLDRARPAIASPSAQSEETGQPDSEGRPLRIAGVPMQRPRGAVKTPRLMRGSGYPTYAFPPPTSYSDQPTVDEGKLFFDSEGVPYQCSATVVTSPNDSLVWTAGHCLYDDFHWSKHVLFCPGYLHGSCDEGWWRADNLWVPNGWFKSLDLAYDLGTFTVYPKHGHTITDRVGSQGIVFNLSVHQLWTDMGYPSANPFSGEEQWWCQDNTEYTSRIGIWILCNFTAGASGGGWIIDLKRSGLGWVNGNNSLFSGNRFCRADPADCQWETP